MTQSASSGKRKVIIVGPAHPLRGGLATFDHRLAKAIIDQGDEAIIYSYALQYPGFLFPGTTQYSDEPAPEGILIRTVINSVNPLNWIKVGSQLKKEYADLIIVRFWLPFMGPALGTILRLAKGNGKSKVIALTDNVIPHEKRPGDTVFTKYFLGACDAFVAMSEKVMGDLNKLVTTKPKQLAVHPLYDNFGEAVSKAEARSYLSLPINEKIILFFGFIRQYKGLDLLLRAMSDQRIVSSGIKLVVAGEFYEDDAPYLELITSLHLQDQVIMRTSFIPDREVRYYLSAADAVIQPYKNATQSGVTPLAYHFEKPMVVTNVGGLPALVPHMHVGVVCAPDPTAIADAILRFYELGEDYFIPHLRTEKEKYSWSALLDHFYALAHKLN